MRFYSCFNSRSPSGLRPCRCFHSSISPCFNSRSPSGLRLTIFSSNMVFNAFQFTQPKRAATAVVCLLVLSMICFNSRSPSGLRHDADAQGVTFEFVSIHAAQAGCDLLWLISMLKLNVSIHAAQAGCDAQAMMPPTASHSFQFTQPKRAATAQRQRRELIKRGFNSRSPSGLRLGALYF